MVGILKIFSEENLSGLIYTNRNVFHLSKSVLVLKAFRYEGIL